MLEIFLLPQTWVALATLTFLEIVLGVDNIIFLTIAANKLNEKDQPRARNIGLALAMILRLVLLGGISFIQGLNKPLFEMDLLGIHAGFSGQSIILIVGGLFLLYKSTSEIHEKLEGDTPEEQKEKNKGKATLTNVIIQIIMINVVFSFDSILTAIGITEHIPIMVVAIVISVAIMMLFAGPVGRFVNEHPSLQMLGLSFLILIGFMLIAEGAHLAHLIEGAIPKGYLYFAIFFSITVEFLNIRLKKSKSKAIHLKTEIDIDKK